MKSKLAIENRSQTRQKSILRAITEPSPSPGLRECGCMTSRRVQDLEARLEEAQSSLSVALARVMRLPHAPRCLPAKTLLLAQHAHAMRRILEYDICPRPMANPVELHQDDCAAAAASRMTHSAASSGCAPCAADRSVSLPGEAAAAGLRGGAAASAASGLGCVATGAAAGGEWQRLAAGAGDR